ncbi:DNA polymerase III subunit gamma/tau [Limosilactobacillus fermentum]|uniref:DNA-directed DNA polymerase n=2 Tax=Bacteria TaxID=2 RepID=A0ABD0ALY0_LIMFE|nr:DNA polymerase III subunit gamma/tau [Limosilactobacillus fermentum]PHI34205.1 DNA polymerase III subunit gamma/tau [Limosilactobacillus fermentum]CDN25350.1 K02343 DNA polymerase III subunit gamma/tau [Limosilactobacillus fermentum]SJM44703.1 DNA polymerase III subunits gamma and tau [Limosilactobacillus fermentum]SJM49379.1 DNA polymerase III subunits gamma and tau [Limosilactobacillus fermentum]GIC71977.1 DNA polymerase III subunit gamma/tau [Limosilactobacillus fermentum]
MSYQALYRVWRPQRFSDLVGQQIVTTTLKNAIITKKISHAYLFAGPRGTGKTSAAKIFAKAVNCHHQTDGEPCNECELCQAITAGQLNDVIEIDAASNNGVEQIRDIRDKVKYAPTQADYKVYIIDEVHMLSTGAFNALLKTLEEPPANVIFILATTEPHKIPLTIISRVQRFDFRRISAKDAFERMKYILDQKKVAYQEDALWVIANAAEGGMRDALSILDQALSFGDEQVTIDDALLVTGSVTKQLVQEYFLQVAKGDSAPALETLTKITGAGKDGQRFIEDLISFIRDVLLYQESPSLIDLPATGLRKEDFDQLSGAASSTALYQMIDTLNDIQQEMRFTTHPDVYLEVLTVRLCQIRGYERTQPGADQAELTQLRQAVAALQQEVNQLRQTPPAEVKTPVPRPSRSTSNKQALRINLAQVNLILTNATRPELENLQGLWGDMLSLLDNAQSSLINNSEPVAASPAGVVVSFDNNFLFEQANGGNLGNAMGAALQQLTGRERQVVFVPKDKWPQMRQDFLVENGYLKKGTAKKEAPKATDPVVSQAEKLFGPDAIEVKND